MKSKLIFNLWVIYCIIQLGTLFIHSTEQNINLEAKKNRYSVKQLKNNFVKMWKNPQKYVEFHLDDKHYPQASGFYELIPSYRKVNILNENEEYIIEWCTFEQKWKLIKFNFLGTLSNFEIEEESLTILEGSRFSRPTKAAITNCQTYEHIKEVIKRLGKTNNELKMKNTELENLKEISEKKSKALENENEILRNKIAEYEEKEEKNKLLLTEHEKLLKENDVMKLDLQSKTKEISYLSNELGGLKYKSSVFDEVDKKCINLEQSLSPMKTDLKSKNTEIQKLQTIVKAQSTTIYNLRSQHSVLKEDLRKMQLDILKSNENLLFAENELERTEEKVNEFEALQKQNISATEVVDLLQNDKESLMQNFIQKIDEFVRKNKKQEELITYQNSKLSEQNKIIEELTTALEIGAKKIEEKIKLINNLQNDLDAAKFKTQRNNLVINSKFQENKINENCSTEKTESKSISKDEATTDTRKENSNKASKTQKGQDATKQPLKLLSKEKLSAQKTKKQTIYEAKIGDDIVAMDCKYVNNHAKLIFKPICTIENIDENGTLEIVPGPAWKEFANKNVLLNLDLVTRLEIGGFYAIRRIE